MKWITTLSTIGIATAVTAGRYTSPKSPLIVHEWGTITTQHAPDGTPSGRLNHINPLDTLPSFVYRYDPEATRRDANKSLVKTALVSGRPDVTMRLETPVMYFYAPAGAATVPPFDVDVHFRGGVLNEFYPNGEASVEVDVERAHPTTLFGLGGPVWDGERLDNSVVSRLRWRAVTLRESVRLTPTSSHIWLAPRLVHAAGVVAKSGQSERYLFYRGVGHLSALLQTQLSSAEVRLRAPKDLNWMPDATMTIPNVWLLDVRSDGSAAFREEGSVEIARNAASAELARLSLFVPKDYGSGKLAALRASMKRALVAAGLYEDEADAMLETWRESYFERPGLRVFYIVPKAWVSYYLPVEISTPHEMTRVLVGRIDLERDTP